MLSTERLTTAQVVAHNLRAARKLRGWTQEEAAERLESYLGVRWSKASFSIAECSAKNGSRPRRFKADEVVAFAGAFDLPVAWFFEEPETSDDTEQDWVVGLVDRQGTSHRYFEGSAGGVSHLLARIMRAAHESRTAVDIKRKV